jgi:hypothetical protein
MVAYAQEVEQGRGLAVLGFGVAAVGVGVAASAAGASLGLAIFAGCLAVTALGIMGSAMLNIDDGGKQEGAKQACSVAALLGTIMTVVIGTGLFLGAPGLAAPAMAA